jgi:sec-independent protein translocase protein TatB
MHLQDMPGFNTIFHAALASPFGHQVGLQTAHPASHLVVARASLSIPDTLFLFVVALVVFGPKRLPEIGKQIGKLVFEFRRASNDFKLQIEEELRLSEQQERQKVLNMQAAAVQPATPVAISAESTVSAAPTEEPPPDRSAVPVDHDMPLTIQPPSSGLPVSALPPNHAAVMTPLPPASSHVDPPADAPPSLAPDLDPAPDSETAHHG